ncbi:MAG TPA: S8 family serine peptidase [Thermoleophilaceae bacterium]
MPLVVILALLLVPGSAAAAGKPAAPSSDGRWIVVYDRAAVSSVDRETEALERSRGFRSRLRFRRAIEGFSARLSAEQVRALRADPDVQAVVPDRPVRARALRPVAANEIVPSGVLRAGLGTPQLVHEASDVGVAVVDTGVDLQHPDLNVADGTNCVTPGAPADDVDGHGTHVAGTIAAENDGLGVTGVAPGTRVHAVKVLNDEGEGAVSQIVCGLDWVIANAAARGIRVVNMSLGTLGESNRNCGVRSDGALVDPLHAAVCRATAAGILNVVAAGNGDPVTGIGWNMSENPPDVPATYPEVLTVTAMADADGRPGAAASQQPGCGSGEPDDGAATFSNYTTVPEEAVHTIAAPGVCILSTVPVEQGSYRSLTGTSMAAPHAAGWAALCIGEAGAPGPCAGMAPAQIVRRLQDDASSFRTTLPGTGFAGDPAAPAGGGRWYGFLLRPAGPETALTAAPAAFSSDSTPVFTFTSPAQGVSFECGVDGELVPCGSPHTPSPLPDGEYTFAVRAVDQVGTPDASPATASFTIDTKRPAVSLSTPSRQRIATVSRSGLRVSVNCSEACRLASTVVVAGKEAVRLGLSRKRVEYVAGRKNGGLATGRRTLEIKLTSATRRRLARNRSALVQLRLTATDAAGNARAVKRSVRFVR